MTVRYWIEFGLNNTTAWYLTYLLYSTMVFACVAVVTRGLRVPASTENRLWRLAVLGVPVMAALRIVLEHRSVAGVRTGPELMTVAGTTGWWLIAGAVTVLTVGAWMSGHLGRVAWSERRRLAPRRPVTDGAALDALAGLAASAGVRPPRLTESEHIGGPIALGLGEICVPEGMFGRMSPAEVRAVMAHELAHLRRRDTPWLGLVLLLERIFFVQPLQRLAGRRILETAEFLADDYAVDRTGSPVPLVDALTSFARAGGSRVAATGFGPGSLLVRRVERILTGDSSYPRGRVLACATLVLAAVLVAWFTPTVVPACDCRWVGVLW